MEHTASIVTSNVNAPVPAPMDHTVSPETSNVNSDSIPYETNPSSSTTPSTETDIGISNQDIPMPVNSTAPIIATDVSNKHLDAASVPLPPSPDSKS